MRQVEKSILLQTLDGHWREHLQMLDHLRHTIGLRGYGQRDPLNEYKTEAFELFESLLHRLRQDVTGKLMHVEIRQADDVPPPVEGQSLPEMEAHHIDPTTGRDEMVDADIEEIRGGDTMVAERPAATVRNNPGVAMNPNDPSTWGKVARNAPCPCGSGKKYKHCHGRVA
jgi:preprotein translocase subunit SecA